MIRKQRNTAGIKRIKEKPSFAVVVDGECEVWYFQMLKRNERHLTVNIKPLLPQRKSLDELYELVVQLSEDYTGVFWVIDYDVITAESNKTKRGKETTEQKFLRYRRQLEKDYKNVAVIVNNPCLEFWFILHFVQTSKVFSNCGESETALKKYMGKYEKTREFFTKQNNDIFTQLKPHLANAIANAEKLGAFNPSAPRNSVSEMFRLFTDTELEKILFPIKSQEQHIS